MGLPEKADKAAVPAKPDKNVAIAPLHRERAGLADALEKLLPVMTKLADKIGKRKTTFITDEEERTLDVVGKVLRLGIQAAKAEAEIKRMDSKVITLEHLERAGKNLFYFADYALEWSRDQIPLRLARMYEFPAFKSSRLNEDQRQRIALTAQGPINISRERLPTIMNLDILMSEHLPTFGDIGEEPSNGD